MKRIFICVGIIFCANMYSQAQKDTTRPIKAAIDTAAVLDSMTDELALFASLMDDKEKSYVNISANVGNQLFSNNNFSLNTQQATANNTGFKPGVGYYHKSGLSISALAFMNLHYSNDGFYQYSVTPAYDYKGSKKWAAGVSYSKYFTSAKDTIPSFASPYDHEFYAYINSSTGLIQPGLSLGYAFGKYTGVFRGKVKGPLGNPINVVDSQKTKQADFSISVSVQHDFYKYNLFKKGDDLSFTPILMLNAGDSKTNVTSHSNKLVNNILVRNPNNRFRTQNAGFQLYSLGLALNLMYEIGKFYIQPEGYFDCYLPETDKRFTSIFSITAGVNL